MRERNLNNEESCQDHGTDGSSTCFDSNVRSRKCEKKMGIRYIPAYS